MADEKDEERRDSKQSYHVRELAQSVDFCHELEEGRQPGGVILLTFKDDGTSHEKLMGFQQK